MGKRPSANHTIERKDNEKNYDPSNCFWATKIQQGNNRYDNTILIFRGESHTAIEWSRIKGISYGALLARLNQLNWSVEKSLTTPVKSRSKNAN